MGKMKIFALITALISFGITASALVEVSALAGYSNTSESVSTPPPSPTVTGKGAFTYGAQVDTKIPESSWGLGVGLWAVTATAEEALAGAYDITFSVPYIQLPVTARYNFLDMFSLGVGVACVSRRQRKPIGHSRRSFGQPILEFQQFQRERR